MKTGKKKTKKHQRLCQLEQFPTQFGHRGMDPVAIKLRISALRRRGGDTTETANWKVLHPELQGEYAKRWSAQPHDSALGPSARIEK